MKYHRSPKTGKSEVCKATIKPCPFGAITEHFYTKEECDRYCDEINEIECLPVSKLKEFAVIDNQEYDLHRTILFENMQAGQKRKFSLEQIKGEDFAEGDSGASIDINNKEYVSNGFAVSPYPQYSKAVKGRLTDEQIQGVLTDYINEHKDVLSQPNHILGLWKSPFDDNLYIDVSIVTKNATIAREVAEEKDQQAYFDFQTFTSITVDKNAKSGQVA